MENSISQIDLSKEGSIENKVGDRVSLILPLSNTAEKLYNFSNCHFKTLVIVMPASRKKYKSAIYLSFWNCQIDGINSLHSPNSIKECLIGFNECIIGGRILGLFNSIELTNCIFRTLTIEDISSVKVVIDTMLADGTLGEIPRGIQNLSKILPSDFKNILQITNCDDTTFNRVYDSYLTEEKVEIRNGLFHNLELTYQGMSDFAQVAKLDINNYDLKSLILQSLNGNFKTIRNSSIDEFIINKLQRKENSSNILLENITPRNLESTFIIANSDLRESTFNQIRFEEFSNFVLYKIQLDGSKFMGCNIPDKWITYERFKELSEGEVEEQIFYKDQYENYLQLKAIMRKNGNFYEELKLDSLAKDSLKYLPEINIWDRRVLKLNSYSSNHGHSLWKPIKWLLITSVPIYTLYVISLRWDCNPCAFDCTIIGHYFTFLNPVRSMYFLAKPENMNSLALFLDFVSKIVFGYLIFQFVAAFRKYGKR